MPSTSLVGTRVERRTVRLDRREDRLSLAVGMHPEGTPLPPLMPPAVQLSGQWRGEGKGKGAPGIASSDLAPIAGGPEDNATDQAMAVVPTATAKELDVEPSPACPATRSKGGGGRRLTVLRNSPALLAAADIWKWRDQLLKRHRASYDPAVPGAVPHPPEFDTLASTLGAARKAGICPLVHGGMLRCGLVGVVGPGDYVESILVPSGLGRRAYRSRAGGVRKWASGFGKSAAIRTFRTLIGESGNYPMYITFCRRVLVDLPPPKKKSAGSPNRTSARKRRRAGGHEIICLLDSSDEEEDQDQEGKDAERNEDRAFEVIADDDDDRNGRRVPFAFRAPGADPVPAFVVDDFVLTPYGPGRVIAYRVERDPKCDRSLFRPDLIYTIDLRFGIAYLPCSQVRLIEGSTYTDQRVLLYQGVSLTRMDILRLWPMTYLNDSLMNFYLRYVVTEVIQHTSGALGADEFYVFPTYFYSRMSRTETGGVAYTDNKLGRQKLHKDLRGWTKGIDIFEKRFLIFPINHASHWSFVMCANPGHVLRVIPPPPPKTERERERDVKSNKGGEKSANAANADRSTGAVEDGSQTPPGTSLKDHFVTDTAERDQPRICPQSVDGPSPSSTVPCGALTEEGCSRDGIVPIRPPAIESVESDTKAATVVAAASTAQPDPPLAPCLIHFDSGKRFKLHNSTTIFKHIRKYLAACFEATRADQYPLCEINAKTCHGIAAPVPQQDNAKDCGVFALEMIERILCDPIDVDWTFIEKKGKVDGGGLGVSWFSQGCIDRKRLEIESLIAKLQALGSPNMEVI